MSERYLTEIEVAERTRISLKTFADGAWSGEDRPIQVRLSRALWGGGADPLGAGPAPGR